eukprot:gene418-600_t
MAEVAQLSNQWKKALQGLSGILFALGLAETIASIIIINTSGGTYAGGIYAGILCMVTGIRGFVMSQGFRLLVLVIFSVLSGIISIVAASLLASNYNFLSSLYACESSSGTCSYISDYSSYCLAAYYCEISTTTVYDCSCAGSTDTCYGINHISCSAILTSLPAQIHASYIISILCIVASCLLAVMSSAAQFRAFGSMNAPLIGSDSRIYCISRYLITHYELNYTTTNLDISFKMPTVTNRTT